MKLKLRNERLNSYFSTVFQKQNITLKEY